MAVDQRQDWQPHQPTHGRSQGYPIHALPRGLQPSLRLTPVMDEAEPQDSQCLRSEGDQHEKVGGNAQRINAHPHQSEPEGEDPTVVQVLDSDH